MAQSSKKKLTAVYITLGIEPKPTPQSRRARLRVEKESYLEIGEFYIHWKVGDKEHRIDRI